MLNINFFAAKLFLGDHFCNPLNNELCRHTKNRKINRKETLINVLFEFKGCQLIAVSNFSF